MARLWMPCTVNHIKKPEAKNLSSDKGERDRSASSYIYTSWVIFLHVDDWRHYNLNEKMMTFFTG